MSNLNLFIFTKTAPKTKLEIIKKATDNELLNVSYDTIARIVKEVGDGEWNKKRSRYKKFYFKNRGNSWNSEVECIFNSRSDKGELWISFYVQGDDTDTYCYYPLKKFIGYKNNKQDVGSIHEEFSNGYSHTITVYYDQEDYINVIRDLLIGYISTKYRDKL